MAYASINTVSDYELNLKSGVKRMAHIEVLPFQSFSDLVIAEVVQETDTLAHSISRAREQYASAIRNARRKEQGRSLSPVTSDDQTLDQISDTSQLLDRLDRDLLRLEAILSEPADGRDLLRQVNVPRQTHFIPEFLLKNFTDENGYLWGVYRKKQEVFQTIPRKIFKQRDLYVSHDIAPSTSELQYKTDYATREGEISKLEGLAKPIINKIIESARKEQLPYLSENESRIFKEFFLSIYRRNPAILEQMKDGFDDTYYQAATNVAAKTGYTLPAKNDLYQDQEIIKLRNLSRQNTLSRFAAGDHDVLREGTESYISKTGLCIINIPNPRRSFIIGSFAFSVKQHSKTEPSWFPIAADTAVALLPSPGQEILLPLKPDNHGDKKINVINFNSAAQIDIFVGRSKTLVRSLINRINT